MVKLDGEYEDVVVKRGGQNLLQRQSWEILETQKG